MSIQNSVSKNRVYYMKKVLFSLAIILSFTAVQLSAQHEAAKNTGVGVGNALPDFEFSAMNGELISKANIKSKQPVIVFYFDPFCDHCQQEASWINENPEMFKGITMLWVSWGDLADIKAFPGKYLPNVSKDMIFTRDDKFEFDNYFGYSNIPTVYVYNQNWIRTATFDKETKPEILVKFARQ